MPRPTGSTKQQFHIIAIDPGLVCGVAVLTVTIPPSGDGYASTMSIGEMPWLDAVAYVNKWLNANMQSVTVRSERYTVPTGRSVMTAQLEAIMCNGALEYVTSQCEVTFRLQPRAEVKKTVPDALLKKLGWFKKTKDGHANDAARHIGFALLQAHPELWYRMTDGV